MHTGIQPYEYVGASPPTNPWCDNWKEVLESNASPKGVKKVTYRKQNLIQEG